MSGADWRQQEELEQQQREQEQVSKEIYKAINNVMADIAKTGIAKSNQNQQQRYNFRGIDDIYNALAPIMAKHGLITIPRVLSSQTVERQTNNGKPLFYTTLDIEYDFVCANDGSCHTARVQGEAMDMADKSTNKAMAAGHKYACLQVFCIPTEGDNDADATTYDLPAREAITTLEAAKTYADDMSGKSEMDKQRSWATLSEDEKNLVKQAKKGEAA